MKNKKTMKLNMMILPFLVVICILVMAGALVSCSDEANDEAYAEENEEAMEEADEANASGEGGKTFGNIEDVSVGSGAKSATIMVYMNGSDLESQSGEATTDLSEMMESGIGENVNVIVQTMGTKEWHDYDISSETAQTYKVEDGELTLLRDDLGQLDCTDGDTLSEFIGFCKNNYPADRYLLLFWNHGGGPVYGFGYDEWQPEGSSLTIAEMAQAFEENKDIHFDIIGMDCCIMASLETCYSFAPYCKYALLSEDFESGLGWSYTKWMQEFEQNPGLSTPILGKYIVDDIIADNETEEFGKSACMGLFNTSTAKNLYEAWKAYAYKNEEQLLTQNFSKMHEAKGRGYWDNWGSDDSDVTLSDYYISDILAIVENVDKKSDEAKKLMSALKAAVAYYGHTKDKNELTGLAVAIPYGDSDFYDQLSGVFTSIGMDDEYVAWLGKFVSSDSDYFDFDLFEDNWDGWAEYESEYGCNISGGGSCEYSYDYDDSDYEYYEESGDDWIYDYDSGIWYSYEGDDLYLYNDETDEIFYYDDASGEIYVYDDEEDDWFLTE